MRANSPGIRLLIDAWRLNLQGLSLVGIRSRGLKSVYLKEMIPPKCFVPLTKEAYVKLQNTLLPAPNLDIRRNIKGSIALGTVL
jgi:hypothetical protein